jgi:asparagine synthase (glutamine-hydrolysing)
VDSWPIWIASCGSTIGGLSNYASYTIAKLTHEAGVPVTLNGQGGDEVFAGYWQSYFLHLRNLARRFRARKSPTVAVRFIDWAHEGAMLNQILDMDEHARCVWEIREMHLPRLLKWDDRNSMAFSVEGRYPFLDHELIELCLSFAPSVLHHRGWTKWPMRLGLADQLPREIAERTGKVGFEVPQQRWLTGPLPRAFENWLDADRPAWSLIDRDSARTLAERVWRDERRTAEAVPPVHLR